VADWISCRIDEASPKAHLYAPFDTYSSFSLFLLPRGRPGFLIVASFTHAGGRPLRLPPPRASRSKARIALLRFWSSWRSSTRSLAVSIKECAFIVDGPRVSMKRAITSPVKGPL